MNDVSPGKLTIIIGGIVVFVCSLMPWISSGGYNVSAWSGGLLPIATWTPLFALAAAVLVALPAFTQVKLPDKILDYTMEQLIQVLVAFSFLIAISYAVTDKRGASIGVGLILCLLGSIAQLVGIFMDKTGVGVHPNSATSGFNAPLTDPNGAPAPFGQQPGYPQQPAPAQQPGYAPPPQPAPQGPPPGAAPPAQPQPQAPAPPPQQTVIPGQEQPPAQPGTGTF